MEWKGGAGSDKPGTDLKDTDHKGETGAVVLVKSSKSASGVEKIIQNLKRSKQAIGLAFQIDQM